MKLYLMRHAEAEDGERLDPHRKLTDEGKRQISVMSDWLVREIGRVDLVISSAFTRAIDTAVPMGQALGCDRVETTIHLDPDGDPRVAWADIKSLTKLKTEDADTAHVLVVTHQPLISKLAKFLVGVETNEDRWHHAAVMHIHDGDGETTLEYFVPPKVVERDELQTVTEVLEECVSIIGETGLGVADAPHQRVSESSSPKDRDKADHDLRNSSSSKTGLHHPKHASLLKPIRKDARAIMRKYFTRQGRIVLKCISEHLKHVAENNRTVKEADTPDAKKQQAMEAISYALPDGYQIPVTLTSGMTVDYSKALSAAISAGYDVMAGELDHAGAPSDTAMGVYLRDNALDKITGELDRTSVDRLRDALADAYESGADYEEMVQTVKNEFADFADSRAKLIAQTEMNNAYNHGRNVLAGDLGFNEKAWSADGPNPCPECIGNVLDGWIGIDETFSSGDDLPTAHPGCYCSVDFRLNPNAA